MKKTVAFSTETTFLFGVDVNGSALPKESGPPIGLARKHHTMTIASLDGIVKRRRRVRKFDHLDRLEMLKPLYDSKTLAAFCYEAIDTRKERIETEEELLQNERRLQARARKRAAEEARSSHAKRPRMMTSMMEYDEDEDEDSDDE
ncbi:hypothetical protein SPRG_00743 [Saprolegnia parasitica CBS 223.65]|uniref:Cysteine/serine-rich nuclear protein N-terminal domain-containing protein n=1 Tax=Saprolegnia parasitica (strain CBS 223.65) TaxID=695850 RepID=A0A067CVJ0_SAPPC|nr:hypothetical protein SPRG_00743 [Saprolegnia parasitica CBS 223.65]KDO34679.1 hypothetical protein SPRG_00743 [Saprolegnia parasitica CBS 223.65]|eukprot:XP_012194352.1 hypothetical protein SPRG_00743 [Saprolegnia parasitica CBS 223.65]